MGTTGKGSEVYGTYLFQAATGTCPCPSFDDSVVKSMSFSSSGSSIHSGFTGSGSYAFRFFDVVAVLVSSSLLVLVLVLVSAIIMISDDDVLGYYVLVSRILGQPCSSEDREFILKSIKGILWPVSVYANT